MKHAVKVVETLTRTVVVEADNYLEAEEKVKNAYNNCDLVLNADNASVDTDFENDTENYIDIFGKEEVENMEEDYKIK